jgi:hypothetical protein
MKGLEQSYRPAATLQSANGTCCGPAIESAPRFDMKDPARARLRLPAPTGRAMKGTRSPPVLERGAPARVKKTKKSGPIIISIDESWRSERHDGCGTRAALTKFQSGNSTERWWSCNWRFRLSGRRACRLNVRRYLGEAGVVRVVSQDTPRPIGSHRTRLLANV